MKSFASAALFLLGSLGYGQAVRVDQPLLTAGPNVPVSGGALAQTLWYSNASVYVCTHPSASLAACQGAPVTTYTDSTKGTSCPSTSQLVQLPGISCTSSAGTTANVGFWFDGGSVDYWVVSTYGTYGPYTVGSGSVTAAGADMQIQRNCSGSFCGTLATVDAAGNITAESYNTVIEANTQAGADASIKINACVSKVIVAGGGVCDARGLGGTQTFSVPVHIGNSSLVPVALLLPHQGQWLSTMNDTTDCAFKIYDLSAMIGTNPGGIGGLQIRPQTGAAMEAVVCTDGTATANQSYVLAKGFDIHYSGVTATVTNALLEESGLTDASKFEDITVWSIGYAGKNVWLYKSCCSVLNLNVVTNCNDTAGCTPMYVGDPGGSHTHGVNFINLSATHAGPSNNEITIDGLAGNTYSIDFLDTHIEENLTTAQTAADIGFASGSTATGVSFHGVFVGQVGAAGANNFVIDIPSGVAGTLATNVLCHHGNCVNDANNGASVTVAANTAMPLYTQGLSVTNDRDISMRAGVSLWLDAGSTGKIRVNDHVGDSADGMVFYSGGSTPTQIANIDGSGNGNFNGNVTANELRLNTNVVAIPPTAAQYVGSSTGGAVLASGVHGSATAAQMSDGTGTSGPVYFAADGSTTATPTTAAQCLAATTVATPCVAYQGSFTALGATGTTGGNTLYTANAPAGATFLFCPQIFIGTAGTGGTIQLQISFTTPGGASRSSAQIGSSTALTGTGASVACSTMAVQASSSLSFAVLAVSGSGSPVWETEPVVMRIH